MWRNILRVWYTLKILFDFGFQFVDSTTLLIYPNVWTSIMFRITAGRILCPKLLVMLYLVSHHFHANTWIAFSNTENFFTLLITELNLKPMTTIFPSCALISFTALVIPFPQWPRPPVTYAEWFNWNPNGNGISVCLVFIWVINHVLNTENVSEAHCAISPSCCILCTLWFVISEFIFNRICGAGIHWPIVPRTITDLTVW